METAIRHSFITIRPAGNLWEISFTYDQILVEAMREIGADWDPARKVWVVAEVAKADALAYANATAGDKQSFLDRVRAEKIKNLGIPKMDLTIPLSPPGLDLKPYQIQGVQFIANRTATLLADQPGLGKTQQAIAAINSIPGFGRVLIVCPANMKRDWYTRMKGDPAYSLPGWLVDQNRTVGVAQGSYLPPTDIVIINYDILLRHRGALEQIKWDLIVCDESHYLKSPKAQRTRAVCGGSRGRGKPPMKPLHAGRKLAMSGTPAVNEPSEIWAICNWLDPKRWPSLHWFEERYCTFKRKPIGRGRFVREYAGPKNLDELNQRLKGTIMLRRTKAEVLPDLPAKLRQVIEIDVNDAPIQEERAALRDLRSRSDQLQAAIQLARVSGQEEEYRKAIEALANFYKEKGEHVALLRQRVAIAKLPYVIDHIRNLLLDPEIKVVVFAHHRSIVDALHEAFAKDGAVKLYGGMAPEEKSAAVTDFQHKPECRVFVGSILASGVGLTLTASSNVVFAELDWVPANVTQAEDRCHRIGQLDSVLVQHIVAHGSLDSHIAKQLIAKQEVLDRVLDGGLAAQEPVDWLGDHRSAPTEDQLSAPVPPTAIAASTYGLRRLVENPKAYGVSDTDLIIAERLCDRELVGKPAALAKWLMDKYLEPKSPAPTDT